MDIVEYKKKTKNYFVKLLEGLGFSRPMINILWVIYTTNISLTQEDIRKETKYCKSMISQTIQQLLFQNMIELDKTENHTKYYKILEPSGLLFKTLLMNLLQKHFMDFYNNLKQYNCVDNLKIEEKKYLSEMVNKVEKIEQITIDYLKKLENIN